MTAFSARIDASTPASCLSFEEVPGSPAESYEQVDPEVVRRMRETLDAITTAA